MSRSRRKTPIIGIAADSEKADKQANHQRERKRVRERLAVDPEPDVLPHRRELSNPWVMGKDGKMWFGERTEHAPKFLRK